jgi:hypothetical protein
LKKKKKNNNNNNRTLYNNAAKDLSTYHEAPAPAPAFGKRRSCRVPLETP